MITEDYVSFEVAKLLKEKGFDGDTNCYYIEGSVDKNLCYSPIRQNHNKRITNNEFGIDIDITNSKISAPTLQMAMKWLREKYSIFFNVNYFHTDVGNKWACLTIWLLYKNGCELSIEGFDIETVYEKAIKYCLEFLI